MSETQTLIEDDAVHLKFGEKTVKVRALTIEKSVDWTKQVLSSICRQGVAREPMLAALSNKDVPIEKRIAEFEQTVATGIQSDLIIVRDLLNAHTPDVMTLDVLNTATANQIVSAFEALFPLENPTKRLQATLRLM
jgi:hypothetical protein